MAYITHPPDKCPPLKPDAPPRYYWNAAPPIDGAAPEVVEMRTLRLEPIESLLEQYKDYQNARGAGDA